MNRAPKITLAAALLALTLSACGGPASDDSDASSTSGDQSASADGSAAPAGEAPNEEGTWVQVSTSSGKAHHTLRYSEDDLDYGVEFEGEETIEVEGPLMSVYVEANEGEDADVSCTIWVDGESVARSSENGDPARCWAPGSAGTDAASSSATPSASASDSE